MMKMNTRKAWLAATFGILLLGSTAGADSRVDRLYLAGKGHIPWQSLSPEEQQVLQDYRGRWNEYDTDRQQRIREGARRWKHLPAEKRHKVEQKHGEYEQLSPEERRRLRDEYRRRHSQDR